MEMMEIGISEISDAGVCEVRGGGEILCHVSCVMSWGTCHTSCFFMTYEPSLYCVDFSLICLIIIFFTVAVAPSNNCNVLGPVWTSRSRARP